jgi:hypothetical protein
MPSTLPICRKYGNEPTMVDGVRFDSRREARVYLHLKFQQIAGEISGLVWDKKSLRFPCVVNGVKVCDYVADFAYFDKEGRRVVCDAKGVRTQVYKLKAKLVRACHGLEITEL